MKKITFFISIVLLVSSCKSDQDNQVLLNEIVVLNKEISGLKKKSKALTKATAEPALMHAVYFKFKDDLTETQIEEFMKAIQSLDKIKQTMGLKTGTPADTGDPRLAKDYDAVLIMGFAGKEALAIYEKDAFHAEVRKNVGQYLAEKPLVYDFWVNK